MAERRRPLASAGPPATTTLIPATITRSHTIEPNNTAMDTAKGTAIAYSNPRLSGIAWYVSKEALRALTVIVPSMANSPIRCSDCQASAVKLATTSISVLGGFIHYLVKSRVDVVCKLDFSYCCVTSCSCSNSKANNTLCSARPAECTNAYQGGSRMAYLLRQRRVEDPFLAKALQ